MSESIAGAPQMICFFIIMETNDLRATNKTPLSLAINDAVVDETAEASVLNMATPEICSTPKTNLKQTSLISQFAVHIRLIIRAEDLTFTLPQNKQLFPFRKQNTLVNNNQRNSR